MNISAYNAVSVDYPKAGDSVSSSSSSSSKKTRTKWNLWGSQEIKHFCFGCDKTNST